MTCKSGSHAKVNNTQKKQAIGYPASSTAAAFTLQTGLIHICLGFASPRFRIGLKKKKKLATLFIQSEVKLDSNMTRSHTFSRAPRQLPVFAWSFAGILTRKPTGKLAP